MWTPGSSQFASQGKAKTSRLETSEGAELAASNVFLFYSVQPLTCCFLIEAAKSCYKYGRATRAKKRKGYL